MDNKEMENNVSGNEGELAEMEKQIRDAAPEIPESLKPDNIEARLKALPESPENRSGERGSGGASSVRRFVYPLLAAASLFLVFGIGLFVGKSAPGRNPAGLNGAAQEAASVPGDRQQSDALPAEATEAAAGDASAADLSALEAENDALFADTSIPGKNYEKAYDLLAAYKESYSHDYVDNGYWIEDAIPEEEYLPAESFVMTEEAAADSFDAANGSFATGASAPADYAPASGGSMQNRQAATPSAAPKEGDYTDTNVRTEGVAEGDIVKTDGKYIYEYDERTERIRIYQIGKGDFEQVGSVNLFKDMDYGRELFISGDQLVILGGVEASRKEREKVCVALYDVTDRTKPKFMTSFMQDGYYHSARITDGILYTFSTYAVNLENIAKEMHSTYIPEAFGDLVPEDRVMVQEDSRNSSYFVITSFDLETGEEVDAKALLAGGDTLYVSTQSIFLADVVYDWNTWSYGTTTELVKLSYRKGRIRRAAEGTIPGYLKDQYSLDEYNGYLRLVCTYQDDYEDYNALYILDDELERVSVIRKLAEGETVRSVRFMGDTGYFVTFRETDPLFSVDLSDPENPELLGYLKIPGFSAYLHPYDADHLLGIGYDTDGPSWEDEIKLSMFDVSDPSDVKEVCTKVLRGYYGASVLENSRAFMFDQERGVFGFSVSGEGWEDEYSEYVVFRFEEIGEESAREALRGKGSFKRLLSYELPGDGDESAMDTRGMIAEDYLYIVKTGVGIASFDTGGYGLVKETMQ